MSRFVSSSPSSISIARDPNQNYFYLTTAFIILTRLSAKWTNASQEMIITNCLYWHYAHVFCIIRSTTTHSESMFKFNISDAFDHPFYLENSYSVGNNIFGKHNTTWKNAFCPVYISFLIRSSFQPQQIMNLNCKIISFLLLLLWLCFAHNLWLIFFVQHTLCALNYRLFGRHGRMLIGCKLHPFCGHSRNTQKKLFNNSTKHIFSLFAWEDIAVVFNNAYCTRHIYTQTHRSPLRAVVRLFVKNAKTTSVSCPFNAIKQTQRFAGHTTDSVLKMCGWRIVSQHGAKISPWRHTNQHAYFRKRLERTVKDSPLSTPRAFRFVALPRRCQGPSSASLVIDSVSSMWSKNVLWRLHSNCQTSTTGDKCWSLLFCFVS